MDFKKTKTIDKKDDKLHQLLSSLTTFVTHFPDPHPLNHQKTSLFPKHLILNIYSSQALTYFVT